MTAHTPGPWFVFEGRPCVGGPSGPIDADPAQKTAGIAMCGMRLRTEDEAMANARLIAAAPELLAELEKIVEDARRVECFRNKTVQAIANRAKLVIAKAKGESS